MLVSIIIPAYRAQATLARAVRSALAQSWTDLELIVTADDRFDYRALLLGQGVNDERLRFVSTDRVASGCHNARNVGLAAARGDFIAALDADDVHRPPRLSALLPLALAGGAVTDNPVVVADVSDAPLYRAFDALPGNGKLDAAALLDLSVPLFPLIAREHAEPRLPGIELGEDFVANLLLIDRLGGLSVCGETLSEYRVVTGSLAHNDRSAAGFEASYTALLERLEHGDKLGLSAATAAAAHDCIARKRELNRAFASARKVEPGLDFQSFVSRSRQMVAQKQRD
jgi:glycosyltransferase involved in cell wall biosynthesis